MVTEITAFTANDGTVHRSKLAALEVDAIEGLKKLGAFNHASAMEVVKCCLEVNELLAPLVEEALLVARHKVQEQA